MTGFLMPEQFSGRGLGGLLSLLLPMELPNLLIIAHNMLDQPFSQKCRQLPDGNRVILFEPLQEFLDLSTKVTVNQLMLRQARINQYPP